MLKYVIDTYKGEEDDDDEDEKEKEKNLIILDDCACCQSVKNQTSELVKLAFGGRHDQLSIIVLTQQLTSISLAYRLGLTKIVAFHSSNSKSWKILIEEFLDGVSKEDILRFKKDLKEIDHSRLEISNKKPYTFRD